MAPVRVRVMGWRVRSPPTVAVGDGVAGAVVRFHLALARRPCGVASCRVDGAKRSVEAPGTARSDGLAARLDHGGPLIAFVALPHEDAPRPDPMVSYESSGGRFGAPSTFDGGDEHAATRRHERPSLTNPRYHDELTAVAGPFPEFPEGSRREATPPRRCAPPPSMPADLEAAAVQRTRANAPQRTVATTPRPGRS
jgi:hypothetical protein